MRRLAGFWPYRPDGEAARLNATAVKEDFIQPVSTMDQRDRAAGFYQVEDNGGLAMSACTASNRPPKELARALA